MSRALPPLDLHAHLETDLSARDLEGLGAVVFAATRSLAEFDQTLTRKDLVTVWGVGCHPGLRVAQEAFDSEAFAAAMRVTPFVSEIGLDGRSAVPAALQTATFTSILRLATATPRLLSVHSYGATSAVVDLLESHDFKGAILHWWLGTADETQRAIDLGCYFSVNHSMARKAGLISSLPVDRLLFETDHPSGDRSSPQPRRPGTVQPVEQLLAAQRNMSMMAIREQAWRNFGRLVEQLGVAAMMTTPIQKMIEAAR
ncbi:TatD family hydrolase [Kribbella sp. NPDC058693]|uniref:TatD family hydrolase n=1 Tax=Kribbella sp. NPDC058693 TaxID=3346602 RepID=UPI00364B3F54